MYSTLTPKSSFHEDEKKPLISPSYHNRELPPTPSSHSLSFLGKESIVSNNKNYGSSSEYIFYDSAAIPSSSTSTVSPNDDDEGLYLLWTHQLLVERGFKPSSCNRNDDDDNSSIDSSITDLSTPEQTFRSQQKSNAPTSNLLPSWLSSWFPLC